MDSSAEKNTGRGVLDAHDEARREQTPANHSERPPAEGSNRGYDTDGYARANIEDSISGRSPKSHSDHTDDGRHDDTKIDDAKDGDPAQPM
jgi:hypothetical protein